MTSPSAYTVFQSDGSPRFNRAGIGISIVFERRLRDAARQAMPGDRIVGWSRSGAPIATYSANGRRMPKCDQHGTDPVSYADGSTLCARCYLERA